ncbi:MAG: hypothetical protein EXQ86_10560 [Rhodospirillales bacterium]|nr:hypothetical protein [Rhodospirillales bacterium]
MPYIIRDTNGDIAAVYNQPVQGGEEVAPNDPALKEFILKNVPGAAGKTDEWVQADLARVIEDLIDILIAKKLVLFTDFPAGAQKKLIERRGLRKEFSYVENLFAEDTFPPEGGQGGGYL